MRTLGLEEHSYKELTLESACRKLNKPLEHLFDILRERSIEYAFDFKSLRMQAPDKIIRYLKRRHKEYGTHRLAFVHRSMLELRAMHKGAAILGREMETFAVRLRHELAREEKELFPYIQDLQKLALDFSSEAYEIFNVLNKDSIEDVKKPRIELSAKFKRMVLELDELLHSSRLQSKELLLDEFKSFTIDLETTELIKEEVLLPKASILEQELNSRIKKICLLN